MRSGTFVWGGLIVIAGFLLLLNNLGLFGEVNFWGVFSPIILIAVGAWFLWMRYFQIPRHEFFDYPLGDSQ